MSWVKYSDKIIKAGGKIATSLNCCCNVCCGCAWLQDLNLQDIENPGTGRIRVTFTGPLSGYAILWADNTGIGHCFRWTTQSQPDLDTISDNCNLGPITSVEFRCLEGDHSSSQMELLVTGGSAGCGVGPWTQTSVSCGPPLSVSYQAVTIENVPGECNPCGDGATIGATVSNEDPLL